MSDNFDNFVDQQTRQATEDKLDLEKEKALWLGKLNDLYAVVRESLQKHIESGSIKVETFEVPLHEELLGTYSATAARITVGNSTVKMEPIGTFLIGARGRVDMTGPRGIARFMLVPPDAKELRVVIRHVQPGKPGTPEPKIPAVPREQWVWKFTSSPPRITYTDLNAEVFRDCLMGVING